jgi:hypothetical protein
MDPRRQRLATALDETGLWRSLAPADRLAQIEAVRHGAYPLHLPVFDDVCFPADGELLADGAAEDLLAAMGPALAEHGLRLKVHRAGDKLVINDLSCAASSEEGREATLRPLAIVNALLAEGAAAVRVFTLYTGGQEGLAYVLDPRVPRAMVLSGLYDRRELPELAAI